jgi:hypothetical protein
MVISHKTERNKYTIGTKAPFFLKSRCYGVVLHININHEYKYQKVQVKINTNKRSRNMIVVMEKLTGNVHGLGSVRGCPVL